MQSAESHPLASHNVPPDTPLHHTKHVAELAVLRAALLTRKVFANVKQIDKHDQTPVTIADFGAQALIMAALRNAAICDGFVGEEDGEALRNDAELLAAVLQVVQETAADFSRNQQTSTSDADQTVTNLPEVNDSAELLGLLDEAGRERPLERGRYWVMDPVDGTAAFIRNEQYAISLALIEDGREVLAVLCYPNLGLEDGVVSETSVDRHGCGVMLSAIRGQGVDYRKLSTEYHLGEARKLDQLPLPTKLSDLRLVDCKASKSSRLDLVEAIANQMGALPYPGVDLWSSHVRYAALMLSEAAEGNHVMIRIPRGPDLSTVKAYIWDHAGSQLLYTEMGGRVTDIEGKTIDFGAGRTLARNRGIVAAPAAIHQELLTLVKEWVEKDRDEKRLA